MGLTHHEGLGVLYFFLLSLKLCKVIPEQSRFFLEVLLEQCKHFGEQLIQLFFDFIRVTLEPSHLFKDYLHLLFYSSLLLFGLFVTTLKPLKGRLIGGLQLLDLMLGMAFSTLPTFDDAHGTEGLTAIETVKFESPTLMPLAHTEAVLTTLEIFHEGLVIVKSEPLVTMKLQSTLLKVFQ